MRVDPEEDRVVESGESGETDDDIRWWQRWRVW